LKLSPRAAAQEAQPEIGRKAAMENINDVMELFPEIPRWYLSPPEWEEGQVPELHGCYCKACKEAGLLTIAVVTIPLKSEGKVRIKQAIEGVDELKDYGRLTPRY